MAKSITKVEGQFYEGEVYKEGQRSEDLTPGQFVEPTDVDTDGFNDEIIYSAISAVDPVDPPRIVVLEQTVPPTEDKGDTDPVDLPYDVAEQNLQLYYVRSGDEIQNAQLAAGGDLATAGNADVSVGDTLGFNDDGTLKVTTTAGAGVFTALESVDNSTAGTGEWARINVEAI
jgi:hypothetical protein